MRHMYHVNRILFEGTYVRLSNSWSFQSLNAGSG